jgi:16S rRNA (guanine527-N7)-methyltransferase
VTGLPEPLFATPLPGLERPLTRPEGDQIDKYLKLLVKWQKSHRLIGSTDRTWMLGSIVLDSFAFLEPLPREARKIADVGSGAGIPGIPMAIVRPDLELTLIEIRQRRVSFLSTVVRELGLRNVDVAATRVEALAITRSEYFDAVVMRCAGSARSVLPHAFAILRETGVVVMAAKRDSRPDPDEHALVRMLDGSSRDFRRIRKSNP